jgi:hypothetical protein
MTTATTQTPTTPTSFAASEIDLLHACQEVVVRSHEMTKPLAETLGVPVGEVFYTWAFRRCRQSGALAGGTWQYFFHGLECDLRNTADGRVLRIDFGPGGSLDTFTAWGVANYIRHAIPPWSEFKMLKQYYEGSKFGDDSLWDSAAAKGAFDRADQSLMDLRAKCTTTGPDGIQRIVWPPEISEKAIVDSSVAHRCRLSALARKSLGLPS